MLWRVLISWFFYYWFPVAFDYEAMKEMPWFVRGLLLLIIDAGNLENNRKLRYVCLDNAHVPLWLAREDSLEVLFLVQHYTNLLSWKPCCSVFEPLYWTTSTSNNSRKINFVLPYVAITYTVHHWEWYGLDDVILEIVLCIVQH